MSNIANLISTGRTRKPINMILHGVHKIGKSTFGTKSPKPIYITGEEIEEVDAAKLPKCETFPDFIKYLKFLRDDVHDYKTLVVDTLDSIEGLCWKQILTEDGSQDMARAMGGFGKAYTLATQRMMDMRDEYLVPIRDKRGMNIILLCHTTKNKFEDPLTQTSYDTFEMKLHKNGKGIGCYTVFSEWVSIIAFANFEVFSVKDKSTGKDYAVGDGDRRMFLTPKPAYDAGNRFNLEEELPLEWNAIEEGVNAFYGSNKNPEVESIKIELRQLVSKMTDEKLKASTIKNIQAVGDDLERLKKAKDYILGATK